LPEGGGTVPSPGYELYCEEIPETKIGRLPLPLMWLITCGPAPCRRYRVAGSALPLSLRGRAKDHRRPLVGPAVLWSQAAAAGLSFKPGRGPWRGLIPRERPSAARSTPENRPTRASSRNSILSTPSARLASLYRERTSSRPIGTNSRWRWARRRRACWQA
jgi:hypothetical protein